MDGVPPLVSPYVLNGSWLFLRHIFGKGRVQKKKTVIKRSGWPLWGGKGGSPPLSLTTSICENFDPFLSVIKQQNNPKCGNLSRNFHIILTALGEGRGGSTQSVSLTAFSQFFFWTLPLVIFTFFRLTLTPKGWCPSWWPEVMIETILKKRISFLWRCGEAYQKFKLFIWPQKVICIFQSIERLFLLWKQFFRKPFRGCFKRSNRTGKVFERLNKC